MGFTIRNEAHVDGEVFTAVVAGSDHVSVWTIEYELDVRRNPWVRVVCSDLYCGTMPLAYHPDWSSGVVVTVLFQQSYYDVP